MSFSPRPLLGNQRGAVAVEFAIILPVLVMLVFAIIQFGRGYNAQIELTGAVREGARALALGQAPADAGQAMVDASPGLSPEPTVTGFTECPNADDRATLVATYALDYDIPLVASGTWNVSVTGVMRCGV